jgi:hypothetical protein
MAGRSGEAPRPVVPPGCCAAGVVPPGCCAAGPAGRDESGARRERGSAPGPSRLRLLRRLGPELSLRSAAAGNAGGASWPGSSASWPLLEGLGMTLQATRPLTCSPATLLPIMPGCATSCADACGLRPPPAWLQVGETSCSACTTSVLLGTSHRGRPGAGTCRPKQPGCQHTSWLPGLPQTSCWQSGPSMATQCLLTRSQN